MCTEKRFEINSLTTLRLKQDFRLNKTRDFCDYLISKIEDPNRAWDLNRYKIPIYNEPKLYRPEISKPKIIEDMEEKINEKIKDINNKLDELTNKISDKQGISPGRKSIFKNDFVKINFGVYTVISETVIY